MTTIVATRIGNHVEFAFDSQVSWGGNKFTSGPKVFTNGIVTFGTSGAVRDGDILEHVLVVPPFKKKDRKNTERWVVRKLIPAILEALDSGRQLETRNSQAKTESHLIIAVNGFLGALATDNSVVLHHEPYVAVGSGSDVALGALYAGATPKQAVEIAAKIDAGTGGKINTLKVKIGETE